MAQFLKVASRSGARFCCSNSASPYRGVPTFLVPRILTTSLQSSTLSLPYAHIKIASRPSVRHASTRAKPPQNPSPADQDQQRSEAVNPPASTRPAVLTTVDRSSHPSTFKYLFALGKAYVAFYKSGVYAVWNNRKAARELQRTRLDNGRLTPDDAVRRGVLTRGEWQLLRRSRADVRKIPLFGLVLMVCGEFTPLVVMAFSGVVPNTCRIPRQVVKDREKTEAWKKSSWMGLRNVQPTSEQLEEGRELVGKGSDEMVHALRWEQVLHAARSLGLYAKLWDTLWDYPPEWLLRRRVTAAVEYLRLDDEVLSRDGKVADLVPDELRIAAEERGISVRDRSHDELTGSLQRWLQASKKQAIPFLVLEKP